MNYAHKCLTRKKFMNTNTQIHVEYLGKYISKSIILESERVRKELDRGERGHTRF